MARVLIVGCGCRGVELASALGADGHQVRGTSRHPRRVAELRRMGIEGVLADPDRLGTLMPHLAGTTVICWLLGGAVGDGVAALHSERLGSLLGLLVDSGVRGIVYEAAGAVPDELLAGGAELVREAAGRHTMPFALLEVDPEDHAGWAEAARAGVARVLGG